MKTNIKFLILSVIFTFGVNSCVSLDTPPYDKETDLTYWETDPNAAFSVLNTCYTYLASMDEQVFSEGMTDNAYVKRPTGYTQSIGNGSYSTADSYVSSVWNSRYSGIFYCNQLLNNIDRVSSLEESLKNRYVGEAKVLRAWHYYELYTKFGAVPYSTTVMSVEESKTIGRTARETVVSSILQELDEVINNNYLPESYSGDDRGRITCWAAKALQAKIHLFEGNWEEVRDITADIMQNGGFSLFDSYSGLFEIANEYNCEVILDAQYRPSSREHQIIYNLIPPSMGGYSMLAPLQELVDNYIMLNGKSIDETGSGYDENDPYTDRDPRMTATIIYNGNSYTMADGSQTVIDCLTGRDAFGGESDCTSTGYYVKKWWDNTYRSNLYSGLNPILIRYADILLMNAEALAELGEFDAAAWNSTIYLLRKRAGFTDDSALNFPTGLSKEQLIQAVRRERRSELALEGLRHKDIIRWKIAEDVLNGWCHGIYTGDPVGTDDGYVRVESRQFDPNKHYLWPIPQSERDLNKNLEQNPNW